MADAIVIGGGVIGLSLAYELAGQGIAVRIVDQGSLGREASWAGAGMLPPGNPAFSLTPEQRLRALSHSLWKPLSEELQSTTGIDNGHRQSGSMEIRLNGSPDQLLAEQTRWRDEGIEVAESTIAELRQREPALHSEAIAGYRLPELGQVRNPRHLKALMAGCATRGVRFSSGTPVIGFDRHEEKIVGIKTPSGTLRAGMFCLCTGAWSAGLAEMLNLSLPIKPVRGQIVLLNTRPMPFQHILQVGSRYLVPRPDGRVLIGSTEEDAGFEKRNTAASVAGLIQFATELVPDLANASLEKFWSGLRPGSPEGVPYLGRVPELENLYIAAGHFRSGLQMSPGTAAILRDLMLGQEPGIPMKGLTCDRHRHQEIPTNV